MKLKQFLTVLMIAAFAINANGQSLEEGVKMYKYERYQTAKKILEPLAANSAQANYYLGLAELALGNTAKAEQIFAKYPENYSNMSGAARVEFAKGNDVQAMQKATALKGKGRKKDWIQTKLAADAITYSKGGDKQQAVNWYEEVLEKNETPEILINAGDAYQQIQSGGGKAMSSYEKAVEVEKSNSLGYSRIGKLWYDAKNYEFALENWKKAQEADPSNPLPYYDLANAYTYVGKYKVALEYMEKYLEHSDKSDKDFMRYAEILYQAKKYKESIEKINELKAKGVFKNTFYGILAYSYMELKDSVSRAMALENVRKYFELQEPSKIYKLDYLNYGRIALYNDLNDTANTYFNKALALDKSDNKTATYREIAESFKKGRNWLNAAAWYKKIFDEYPDQSTATDFFWSGVSFYYGRDFNMADTVFAQMIAKHPEQPSGPYWRGRVNAALDQKGEEGLAVPYYTQWLELEKEGYTRKNKDLMQAYQYLALYYYNSDDKDNAIKYVDLILAIDSANKLGTQIKEFLNKS